ncbi:MAG: DMT family transporter [Burkholderiaceae bacterium]|nr:DMT family transporter [Burkholderiaceae bacterium]
MPATLPVLALLFNALVWGVSWWPLRSLHEAGLHPLWATALVYLAALLCMVLLMPASARSFLRSPVLWLLAAAAGLTNICFNWAVTLGDVVRVVLLFYLMPAWSVLLAWWILGERPSLLAVLRLVLAFAGVVLVVLPDGAPLARVASGLSSTDFLAVAGGFFFALTNVFLRRFNRTPERDRMLAMFSGGFVMAAAGALAATWAGLASAPPAPAAGWLLVAAGLALAFVLGNLGLQYGAARLAAGTTALVMLSEVLFASLSSWLLDAAQLSPRMLAGGALIVLAALLALWPGRAGGKP